MRRNFYNIKVRGTGAGEYLTAPDGTIITDPDGNPIIIGGTEGPIGEIDREGYQFYNVQLDRILYYLTCSNGDSLGSISDIDLRAYNVE